MARPAAKRQLVAVALEIPVAEVPERLRRLHQASSLRLLAGYLTAKGVPTSKSWLQRELGTVPEGGPTA